MTAKKLIYLLASFAAIALLTPTRTFALDPEDYAEPPALSSVFITAVQTSHDVDYVELYNNDSSAANLSGWQLGYDIYGTDPARRLAECSVTLTEYLLAEDYGLMARAGILTDTDGVAIIPDGCGVFEAGQYVRTVRVTDGAGTLVDAIHMTKDDSGSPWARRGLTPSYRTDVFGGAATVVDGKYKSVTGASFTRYDLLTGSSARPQAYTGGWYVPPAELPEVRIVEILPRPRGCSPTETSLACADYVKLWVGAGVAQQDLAAFALRTDSGGLSRTSGNGADLTNFPITDPGYITVPIALSNDGGYVWLDDIFGAQTYGATVVQYPSAEAAAREGAAWALDQADGAWRWTSAPQPDAPNYFPPPAPTPVKVAARSTLTPCREGQERNPATNRCRSTVSASAQRVPCREGQERNPATNRCRSVLAASKELVPCAAGQERNPETNRCRKVALTGDDIPLVTDVPSESRASRTGWIIAGIAVVGAGAYALYEWRDVLRRRFSLRRK